MSRASVGTAVALLLIAVPGDRDDHCAPEAQPRRCHGRPLLGETSARKGENVLSISLAPDDLLAITRACAAFRMPYRAAPWMQRFLVERLAKRNPDLARKIGQLDQRQLDYLCQCVQAQQASWRWVLDGTESRVRTRATPAQPSEGSHCGVHAETHLRVGSTKAG
jgi:hypothetical protein